MKNISYFGFFCKKEEILWQYLFRRKNRAKSSLFPEGNGQENPGADRATTKGHKQLRRGGLGVWRATGDGRPYRAWGKPRAVSGQAGGLPSAPTRPVENSQNTKQLA